MITTKMYWDKIRIASDKYFIAIRNNRTYERSLLKSKLKGITHKHKFQVIYLDMLEYARIYALRNDVYEDRSS